jgi:nicotinate-nucleotide pyrophosphorylase (carboxylating)
MLDCDLRAFIGASLAEDIGPGDVTTDSIVPAALRGKGTIKAKQDLMPSGLDLVGLVFDVLAPGTVSVTLTHQDGIAVKNGTILGEVHGPFATLLKGERLALNLLMRLSGIATMTRLAADALSGGKTRVLDTRKTTPGLRWLEKRAVRHGGGTNHRHHLGDGVLIKDNHIAAAGGSCAEAIKRARAHAHHLLKIECEIQRIDQIDEAIAAGAHVLLLDNMDDATLQAAIARVAGRVQTEASGNMTIERLTRLKHFGLDFVSMGALTHSAPAADLSLKIAIAP